MRVNYIIISALCFLITTGCIKQVQVEQRAEKPRLVVEGSVTTDSVPYIIKLTYSGKIIAGDVIPDNLLEKNATVTIKDDAGNSTGTEYVDSGNYRTTNPAFIGVPGRSYTITIELKDGKKYTSTPEKLPAPVPIAAVNVNYVNDFDRYHPAWIDVRVDVNDPATQENYYKWDFLSWIPRHTNGVSCGFGCIEYDNCFQRSVDSFFNILSDASFNGNTISNMQVGRSYIYWYGKHYMDIKQRSLTREAYQFWERYNDQKIRTGSILDPLPASIKGNIHNAADETDFALGYFSAEGVTHKKAVLVPLGVTDYLLGLSAKIFVPEGSKICFEAFPDALPYGPNPAPQYPPPPGWESAEEIRIEW